MVNVEHAMTRYRTRELTIHPRVQLALLTLVTFIALAAYIAGTFLGISVITPLLFYFPIILAAYWYPRQGVLFAVVVGILEVFFIYFYSYPSLPDITFAGTTASFYVLVAIAVVISSLSGGLKDREARYRGIFNNSEAGIFLLGNGDSHLVIEEANPGGGSMLGCSPATLKGESIFNYWKDTAASNSLIRSLSATGSIPQMESVMTRKDGSDVPVLISGSSLPGGMLVLTVIDISARKSQEEEIQARNEELSITNRVIAEAAAATGLEEMLQRMISTLMTYLDCDFGGVTLYGEGSRQISAQIHTGEMRLFQEIMDADGDAPEEWRGAICEGKGLLWKGAIGQTGDVTYTGMVIPLKSGTDVTGAMYFVSAGDRGCPAGQRQTLESLAREIGTAVSRLTLAQRLMETNQQANLYLDILMHDINNANLASLWYGDLLLEMLSGEAKDMAKKMMDGIQKSREVIRNVETIRKIQVRKNNLVAMNLDTVIKKEMRLFPDADIRYWESGTDVWADDLLGEIFANLIGNSIRFGGQEVSITLSVSQGPQDRVEILVSDTGPGIPDDLKKVVFRRFSHTHEQSSGKGLGLYIVKTLLERYGGDISVADRIPGDHTKGTVFRVTLQRVIP